MAARLAPRAAAATILLIAFVVHPAAARRLGGGELAGSPALAALVSAGLGRDDAKLALVPTGAGGGAYRAAVRGGASAAMCAGELRVEARGHRLVLAPAAIGRSGRLAPLAAARAAAVQRTAANRVDFDGEAGAAWFVNGALGLEQGWTVRQRPGGEGELRLSMALGGDLAPAVAADGRSLTFSAVAGEAVLRYGGLAAYDARGQILAARFELAGGRLLVRVQDQGASYPVTVDPFVQVAKLLAADGLERDSFGNAVAISSDGSTVAVASPGATIAARFAQGAIYVFARPPSGWTNGIPVAKLTASDGAEGDALGAGDGTGVAISADGSTVVSAAPFATISGHLQQGATYVFTRPGAAWSNTHETAKLSTAAGAAGDSLAFPAVSGDGSTVVVGASNVTVAGHAFQGAAYVFVRPEGGWTTTVETARLTAADGAADDAFGVNVAVSADGATIAAGAEGARVGGHATQGAV